MEIFHSLSLSLLHTLENCNEVDECEGIYLRIKNTYLALRVAIFSVILVKFSWSSMTFPDRSLSNSGAFFFDSITLIFTSTTDLFGSSAFLSEAKA